MHPLTKEKEEKESICLNWTFNVRVELSHFLWILTH